MATDYQLLKATAVCTDILRRYHGRGRTPASKELMVAEIATLMGWLSECELCPHVKQRGFLAPIREYLLTRHGSEAGGRIFAELIEVLDAAGTMVAEAGADIQSATVSGG